MRNPSKLVASNLRGALQITAGLTLGAFISLSMTSGAQAAHIGPKVSDQLHHYAYCLSILGTPKHAVDCAPSNNSPPGLATLTSVGGGNSQATCKCWWECHHYD